MTPGTPETTGKAARRRRHRRWTDALAIIALIVIAAGLRAIDLDRNPAELFEDELSGAVSAWSVVTTGHDVGRTLLPFLVTELEAKQPVYFYATIPFQAVLGPTTFAIRLPAVLFGAASTLLLAWLLLVLRTGRRTAFVGGLLFATSPWAIHYARAGWEPAAYLPFAIGGVGLLWIGLERHQRAPTIAAAVVLAVGAYTYHPALLMDVVLPLAVVAIHARRLRRSDLVGLGVGIVLAAAILIPYALAATDPLFLSRTAKLSVFRDGITPEAFLLAWNDYWAQWSPTYLFGGIGPNPRINPGTLLYVWTLPFLLLGLDRLVHRRRRADILILAWLVLGALPAALSDDQTTPHAARGILALPAIVMVTAIGLTRAVGLFETRARLRPFLAPAAVVVLVVGLVSLASFGRTYLGEYPARSADWWGFGRAATWRAAEANVPAGGLLCIANSDIGGFTYAQQLRYYLPDPPFTIQRGLDAARCREPGTYLLAYADRELEVPTIEVVTLANGKGEPRFRLSRVVAP